MRHFLPVCNNAPVWVVELPVCDEVRVIVEAAPRSAHVLQDVILAALRSPHAYLLTADRYSPACNFLQVVKLGLRRQVL